MIRKVLVVALIWSTAFLLIPRTPQLVFAETTTTTTVASTTTVAATTTTAATTEKQLTGGTMALLQLSEQQLQMRFNYSISGSASGCMAQGPFTETWSISPSGGSWEQNSRSWTVGFCGNVNDSGLVFNVWGLSPGTTYTVSVSGGYPGNMVSGSRSITTNGSGWGSTTTSTISSGTSTSTSVSSGTTATTVFYNDPALYMARINSSNVVIDVCVCSESFVRENPSRYPGTWVPMWMGVNGKNYAGPGWIYNPVAENFYPPTTTTTSTTSPSSITIEPTATSSSLSSSSSSNFDSSTTTTAVPSGEVRASVGGVEVEAKTTVGKNAVTVSFGEVKAEISNKGVTDNSTNTDTQQGLVLSSGESADVSIDGLQPNSEVEVVIYSTPRNLGSLQVNEFGELVASIEIPSNMESGSHTLVLKGLDKFGKQIELKFGLVVYSPDAYIPVWVWFLIGLLFILLSLSFISRRSTKA
jgi:hypothetical protein